jgi:radical SAM family uncharacterized protein/radical SAM-linked protein
MSACDIRDYLPLVRRPSRYIGAEVNSVRKDLSKARLKFGLGFPDLYDVGMSHLGVQILYQTLNAREDIACERVFAPWADMEALLRGRGERLSTLESGIALNELDIMGFSLQYELSYTNVLNMLDLGGITPLAAERGALEPFVIGGGPAAFNPEPVADFFDAFLLGDGEEAVIEIADAVMEGRRLGEGRDAVLKRLSRIEGVYVPSFYRVEYNRDSTVWRVTPLVEGLGPVTKRIVPDLDALPMPVSPVVPFTETIHDRAAIEISRGCTRGCRFCQAGMIYRPVRERSPERVLDMVRETIRNTGYDEVSLLSLSAGDYTGLETLLASLMSEFAGDRVAVSLPSLRVGTLGEGLASEIRKVRKTGFTLAPEAGSPRLRDFINKGISEDALVESAREVFGLGWGSIKLYFMIGLPTETDADLEEIARVAARVRGAGRKAGARKAPQVNVSVSTFVPKPHTPFQWEPQISVDECRRKQALIRKTLNDRGLGFKWSDPEMGILEGVFARGDRRLSRVVLRAFEAGCRFDGWGERFRPEPWAEAFRAEGIDPGFYTARTRRADEVFPWDHLAPELNKGFLLKEIERARMLSATPDCKVSRCSNCGVCDHKAIRNRAVAAALRPPGPAGGGRDAGEPYKVRLRFSKTGWLRFLGHLELVTAVSRAARRAGLPVRHSQGFHPLPRLTFSQPLPVGIESVDEYLDVELEGPGPRSSPEDVAARLNDAAPDGLRFHAVGSIPLKLAMPSAMMTEYLVFLKDGPAGLDIGLREIDGFLRDFHGRHAAVARVAKEDRVTEVDIKPLVAALTHGGDYTLRLTLKKGGGASPRPHDVLACLLNLSSQDSSLIPILKTRAVL